MMIFTRMLPHALVPVLLATAIGLVSCGDDDPLGPVIPGSPIPLEDGTTFQYQLTENVGVDDTCDVTVEVLSASTPRVRRTRWIFDYHGAFDTLYSHIGNDSVIQYIGLVPPPDTAEVRREGNVLIFDDFPLCEIGELHIEFPLLRGKTWNPISPDLLFRYRYTGTALVDSAVTVSILDHTYEAYRVSMDIRSSSSTEHAWNHLEISAYIVPGTGLIAMYNTMWHEEYPNSQFLGMIAWEMLPLED